MQKQFMGVAALGAVLAVADASHAQAVQWRVEDGGNGHWYALRVYAHLSLLPARADALREGGDLASIASEAENAFIATFVPFAPPAGGHPTFLIGAVRHNQTSCNSDDSAFRWLDGTPFSYTNWCSNGNPNCWGEQLVQIPANPGFDDCWGDVGSLSDSAGIRAVMVEWSADCNNDGIVDYGQCRDGSLPDYNGNNIPDCCETGATCIVGQYPVQWRTEDGGNGHWYGTAEAIDWSAAVATASSKGAHLATPVTSAENSFVYRVFANTGRSRGWIGLEQVDDQLTVDAGWRWLTGEDYAWTNWICFSDALGCAPDDSPCFALPWRLEDNQANCATMEANGAWDDLEKGPWCDGASRIALLEWSADCNNDGIVDYGQILQGQLADTNQNGVPDSCETPNCTSADLFRDFNVNGADLGILLAQWGPVNSLTVSDLNRDGAVDGVDLGLLLSFWGPCPG